MLRAEDSLTAPAVPPGERDDGLRRLLTWTFVALVLALGAAAAIAQLAIHMFDTP